MRFRLLAPIAHRTQSLSFTTGRDGVNKYVNHLLPQSIGGDRAVREL
jgi:hypothetical protein